MASAQAAENSGDDNYNLGVAAWRAKDFAKARKHWELALTEGGPDEAYNNLGYLLFYGQGGEADQSRAVALWRKGAALGVSEAQLHLGQAYEEGAGVRKNLTRAYAWYLCAARAASKRSQQEPLEQRILDDIDQQIADLVPRLSPSELASGRQASERLIAKYSNRLSENEP